MSVFEGSRYEKVFVYTRRFRNFVRNTLTFREIDRTVPAGSILHLAGSVKAVDPALTIQEERKAIHAAMAARHKGKDARK